VYDGEEGEEGREAEDAPRAGDGGVAEETDDIKVESGDISAVMS